MICDPLVAGPDEPGRVAAGEVVALVVEGMAVPDEGPVVLSAGPVGVVRRELPPIPMRGDPDGVPAVGDPEDGVPGLSEPDDGDPDGGDPDGGDPDDGDPDDGVPAVVDGFTAQRARAATSRMTASNAAPAAAATGGFRRSTW
ncbi:hypothetical protein AMIS_26680 [Actinoplanes missouriensis 431]|uniref:Uncharacterized protein n=1 Tax=Actinoplanes missouriensis (strain ATCC 14538 / DSM 43046 / CBS 188.64 / JCM 3121 / NBRC 102363 / NCIMB 12654 / NRRL B-3342 / UNCC 431) TaxID=512565 RepID=I0H4F1_ACTM4|nr:hypothetical protein [Actinoplanes missouriensis]BAL87888.1 hypothetical protein AMIS_26680 [Actinoplanes missouriensis 431]